MSSSGNVFNMISRVMGNGPLQKNRSTYFKNKEMYIKISRAKEGYENVHFKELTEAEKLEIRQKTKKAIKRERVRDVFMVFAGLILFGVVMNSIIFLVDFLF